MLIKRPTQSKKEKIRFYGVKQMAGVVFLSENQCEVLLRGQENAEGVGEGILFSSQISFKFPYFPW